jgi:hypothetical protein
LFKRHLTAIDNRNRCRHLVPVTREIKFVFVDLFAYQRSVGTHESHLTDISLVVVLVNFPTSQVRSGYRKVLVFSFVAIDVLTLRTGPIKPSLTRSLSTTTPDDGVSKLLAFAVRVDCASAVALNAINARATEVILLIGLIILISLRVSGGNLKIGRRGSL